MWMGLGEGSIIEMRIVGQRSYEEGKEETGRLTRKRRQRK